jgi:hypothetical protein
VDRKGYKIKVSLSFLHGYLEGRGEGGGGKREKSVGRRRRCLLRGPSSLFTLRQDRLKVNRNSVCTESVPFYITFTGHVHLSFDPNLDVIVFSFDLFTVFGLRPRVDSSSSEASTS